MRDLNLKEIVLNYLKECHFLEIEPRKNNNPVREFAETKKRVKEMREAKTTQSYSEWYGEHEKAWKFEYGDFIIRAPSCGKDLVNESLCR